MHAKEAEVRYRRLFYTLSEERLFPSGLRLGRVRKETDFFS